MKHLQNEVNHINSDRGILFRFRSKTNRFKLESALKLPDRSEKLDDILNDIKNLNNPHSKNLKLNSNQIEPSSKISSKTRRALVKGARNARNFASVVASGSSDVVGVPITSEDALREIKPAPKPF